MDLQYEYIKQKWLEKIWHDNETFNLYIDSPFCLCKCKYCIYNSTKIKSNDKNMQYYYDIYLPNEIVKNMDIIKSHNIDTVYFGGGTSSLMTIYQMEHIFRIIPNFKDIPNKVFECSPNTITEEKLDLLSKYNFSYITIGVQTLNKEVLKNQNRLLFNEEKLKNIIKYADKLDIHVSCDLLAYMENDNIENIQIIENDLNRIMKEFKPHVLDVYPMYQKFSGKRIFASSELISSKEEKEKNIRMIIDLRRAIMKSVRKNKDYHILENNYLNITDSKEILHNVLRNYFLLRIPDKKFRKKYSCTGFPNNPKAQNTLSIGGYGIRAPYSYHNRHFGYITTNENWQTKYKKINQEDKNNEI